MSAPLVSVIVPVYKVPEGYLRKCIESIVGQTLKEIEIILVDDGSPDNCGVICDEYASKDERVKVIHQQNKGLSGARNSGVKAACGKWITMVDGDDWLEEVTLEQALSEGEKAEVQIVIWGAVKDYNGKLEPYNYTKYLEDGKVYVGDECKYVRELLLHYNASIATAYSKLIRRDFIIENNIYHDEVLRQGAEGLEYCLRLLVNAHKILFINTHWYHYIYNPNSISARSSEANNNYIIKCFEKIKLSIGDDENLRLWLNNRLLYVIITTAISGYFHPENIEPHKLKKSKYREFLKIPIIAEALKTSNKKELSKQRLIILWLIKHKIFFAINILAKIRYRQKNN